MLCFKTECDCCWHVPSFSFHLCCTVLWVALVWKERNLRLVRLTRLIDIKRLVILTVCITFPFTQIISLPPLLRSLLWCQLCFMVLEAVLHPLWKITSKQTPDHDFLTQRACSSSHACVCLSPVIRGFLVSNHTFLPAVAALSSLPPLCLLLQCFSPALFFFSTVLCPT